MNTPLVSIVMPCYQAEATVGRTVDSILAQTMPDFELIAVDDGSTDGTGALLDALAAQDARIRVIHQQNGGVACARNAGMAAARGRWLAFADADDLLLPDALFHLLSLDDGVSEILCSAFIMRHIGGQEEDRLFACAQGDLQVVLESLVRGDSGLNPMYGKLYRTEWVQSAALSVPPGVKVGEDVLFNLEAFVHASSWRMDDCPVYVYTWGGDSAMARAQADVYAKSQRMLEGIAHFVQAHGLETALFRAHIDIYLRTLRKDRGRLRAAFSLHYRTVGVITRGVRFSQLCAKQKLYYLALRTLPCLSYFLP